MIASKIIMVRPCNFNFNPETAFSNHFQSQQKSTEDIQSKALAEFDEMARILDSLGIEVNIYEDTLNPQTPDSIFPNNWFTTHEDGTIVLFPMEAPNRRLERREDIINELEFNYYCQRIIDFTDAENIDTFLEGTGSIVFDHKNKIAFACRSSRTDETLFRDYCESIDYTPIIFDALDQNNHPIYHTNVMMHIGLDYVVICKESIPSAQWPEVENHFLAGKKRIVPISFSQMNEFAGNMLQLKGTKGNITVLSTSAYNSLKQHQIAEIEISSKLVPISIPIIETIGGGSVRCMIAEIFLEKI